MLLIRTYDYLLGGKKDMFWNEKRDRNLEICQIHHKRKLSVHNINPVHLFYNILQILKFGRFNFSYNFYDFLVNSILYIFINIDHVTRYYKHGHEKIIVDMM